MRWQPRWRGGRVTVFWAHFGDAIDFESDFVFVFVGGFNTAFMPNEKDIFRY